MSEVNHRSRNLLAVAQAIARRSVTSGETARNFERKFSERLLGLVASQELLTRHDWRGVPLDALVRAQTFDSLDNHAPRISAEGPSIVLNPSAAQTLGLALHELWSNAVRYGALSNDAGCVNVRWKLDETNGEPRFEMEWREHGGPPPPRKPSLGFGSIVIERMVAAGLPGDASLTFEDEGVHWRVSAPYKQVIVTH